MEAKQYTIKQLMDQWRNKEEIKKIPRHKLEQKYDPKLNEIQ